MTALVVVVLSLLRSLELDVTVVSVSEVMATFEVTIPTIDSATDSWKAVLVRIDDDQDATVMSSTT